MVLERYKGVSIVFIHSWSTCLVYIGCYPNCVFILKFWYSLSPFSVINHMKTRKKIGDFFEELNSNAALS